MQQREDEHAGGGAGVTFDEATGAVEHEWHAKDDSGLWCTFGRTRGIVTPLIHQALGPSAGVPELDTQFRSLLGIRTWNGKNVPQILSLADFKGAMDRFAVPRQHRRRSC